MQVARKFFIKGKCRELGIVFSRNARPRDIRLWATFATALMEQ